MTRPLAARILLFGIIVGMPGLAHAQSFGSQPGREASQAATAADPVTVEVRRDGRLFWLGGLQPGLGFPGQSVDLTTQPAALRHCFDSTGTAPASTRSLDRLVVAVRRSATPFAPDRYGFRFDWQAISPVLAAREHFWAACAESGQRVDGLGFEAEVQLPPGVRVRVDAASGFEIYLTRPADADSETPAPGHPVIPRPIRADFDVTVERAGELLWQGTLHQETSADEPRTEVERYVPRRIACRYRARLRRCVGQSSDRWTLKIRAIDPNRVAIEFYASRSEPKYRVRRDGYTTDREVQVRNETRPTIDLVRGGTALARADDFVIRVGRR